MVVWAHWISAGAISLAYGLVWSRELVESENVRGTLLALHRQLGLLVLLLWGLRLVARRLMAQPDQGGPLPDLLRWGAALSHGALYFLLLAMPLLGWAMTSAQGHPIALFNLFALPPLTATDPDLVDTLQDWHEWASWCLLGLVTLHALAALWHHHVRRDGVLASMLPFLQPLPQRRFDR
ncbi:MAG: cytochrome-c oxidase [Betaproteobacteria bacterium HGW-Betaproteobacteria-3]|jgi:cytochrome b561|nr:MAG: cytochrome-c oxidase [Betaproteobacteria bacterium HGW-Betaproteobacteria-3]